MKGALKVKQKAVTEELRGKTSEVEKAFQEPVRKSS